MVSGEVGKSRQNHRPPSLFEVRPTELNTKESVLDGDGGGRLDGWMRLGSFRFEMNEDVRGNMG